MMVLPKIRDFHALELPTTANGDLRVGTSNQKNKGSTSWHKGRETRPVLD